VPGSPRMGPLTPHARRSVLTSVGGGHVRRTHSLLLARADTPVHRWTPRCTAVDRRASCRVHIESDLPASDSGAPGLSAGAPRGGASIPQRVSQREGTLPEWPRPEAFAAHGVCFDRPAHERASNDGQRTSSDRPRRRVGVVSATARHGTCARTRPRARSGWSPPPATRSAQRFELGRVLAPTALSIVGHPPATTRGRRGNDVPRFAPATRLRGMPHPYVDALGSRAAASRARTRCPTLDGGSRASACRIAARARRAPWARRVFSPAAPAGDGRSTHARRHARTDDRLPSVGLDR
jgi:hypothetical protein